jgi:predicted hydrolase (HD superfamily)
MQAVEAVMRALAGCLGAEADLWGVTGLLHDLDYAETAEDPQRHARLTCQMLAGRLPDEALHAILAHCGHVPAETPMDWALYCADPTTGLIVAAALMHPSKKLGGLDAQFLLRRFNEKRFAAGADREQIKRCGELGLELEDFLGLSLAAMQGVAAELGL